MYDSNVTKTNIIGINNESILKVCKNRYKFKYCL